MSNDLSTKSASELSPEIMLKLVGSGDTRSLSPAEKLAYYKARCDAAGLDPRAQPFQFVNLSGKEVLYALKAATDQLSAKHGVMTQILEQQTESDIRTVIVRASTRDGRSTDEIGAVNITGLKGDALANAMMKAVTKAKRRAILAVCGLGMMDETEVETIPGARAAEAQSGPPPAERMPKAKVELVKTEVAVPKADPIVIVDEKPAEIVGKVPSEVKVSVAAAPAAKTPDLPVMFPLEVTSYVIKKGRTAGKTKYGIKFVSEQYGGEFVAGTYSESFAEVAKRASASGVPCLVDIKKVTKSIDGQDKTYYDLEHIEEYIESAGPGEPEAEQEGELRF